MKRQLKFTAIDFDSDGNLRTARGTFNVDKPTHTDWNYFGIDKVKE